MKKIISILTFLLLLLVGKTFALNNPSLRCVAVLSTGAVQLTWMHPTDLTGFNRYELFYSLDGNNFTLFNTIIPITPGNPDVNSAVHLDANANVNPKIYYYMAAISNSGSIFRSDTLVTIEFYLTNPGNGLAQLNWAAPVSPLLPSYSSNYDIYKKNPSDADFVFLRGVSSLSFIDTINICSNTVAYKVVLSDMQANCRNVSRIQSDIFTDMTYPSIPVLDSVSVDYNSGNIVLGWDPSSSTDAIAYIIYYLDPGNLWIPIDTVYGRNITQWVDLINNPSNSVFNYRIAALDSCMNSSPMTVLQKTMHISYTLDICLQKAFLSWTPYENMKGGLSRYEIYYSRDGGPLQYSGQTTATVTNYTLSNVQPNSFYKVIVRAMNADTSVTASSAAAEFQFVVTESDHFAYIRYVSVIDEKIEVGIFTSGDSLEFSKMQVYRSVGDDLNFVLYSTLPYSGAADYIFIDEAVSVQNTFYYYRVNIISECDISMAESNVAHNIIISGVADEAHRNTLQWLGYGNWEMGVNSYSVFQKLQTEELFAEIDNIAPNNFNTYVDDVSGLFSFGSDFEYYVEAVEETNSYGFSDRSRSNRITLKQMPTTYLPNAFTPNGLNNKVFMPINSFVSTTNYSFSIFSRNGELIFQTIDPYTGWDGTCLGKYAELGVYVYLIKYIYPDGTPYEKIGTVTLLR